MRLTPPIQMSLEEAIAYIADDELVEVTPKAIRLRKRRLDANDRKARRPQRGGGIAQAGRRKIDFRRALPVVRGSSQDCGRKPRPPGGDAADGTIGTRTN